MKTDFVRNKLSQLEESCRNQGIPVTVQRRLVMEELAGRIDHPTADQVHASVEARLKGIARTTVYRVLETFVELDIIRRVESREASSRFDANTKRHHHVQCISCGAVADIHDERLNGLPMPESIDYVIHDYSVSFIGLCQECRRKTPLTESPGAIPDSD